LKYYLFIDESGDHGLSNLNPNFPVFLLCGIIISDIEYEKLRVDFNAIKTAIWSSKNVIFHSRDIRKCEKEFKYLFDLSLKSRFYNMLDSTIKQSNFSIISAAINKERYIELYGRLSNDVYEKSLSFVIERAIFFLDDVRSLNPQLEIVIEKRGKKEDKKLDEHFQRINSRGTGFIKPNRLLKYNPQINFKDKKENINGLQLADLIAYPIARYVMDSERVNPSYEVFKDKFYSKNGKKFGLKIYP
jgi:hypothetical protein